MNKLLATTTFLALAGGAAADGVIIEQIFDHTGGLSSERNTLVPLATTADDFVITDKNTITGIWATFAITTDPPPIDWEFDIYANGVEMPGDLIAVGSGGIATDTGDTFAGLAVHDVRFKGINIGLEPGTYWLGVRGVGQMSGRAFWGAANTGNPNGSDVMLKSEFFGFPDWIHWRKLVGLERDVAFTLHGVPSPGALALLGIAGLAGGRRRRV